MEKAIKRESSGHLGYLDGLRACAAVYVVFHHACQQFFVAPHSVVSYIIYPFKYGHIAVDLFIVLSGYCLMIPVVKHKGVLKDGTINFFIKRAKRILPPYYIAIFISLILGKTIISQVTQRPWDASIHVNTFDIWTHFALIQDLFMTTNSKINYVLWSVSVECKIYLLFPLLVFLWQRYGLYKTLLFSLSLSAVVLYILSFTKLNQTMWGINPQYFSMFVFGMIGCHFSFDNDVLRQPPRHQVLLYKMIFANIVCFIVAVLLERKGFGELSIVLKDVIIGADFSFMLYLMAVGRLSYLKRFLSNTVLVTIGVFAYSIYLMHAPFLQVLVQYIIVPLKLNLLSSILILLSAGTVTITGVCYLFFLIAEKPFMTKKKVAA